MRIAYLSAAAIPSQAANSIQVMKMCEAMADSGHDVTLLAPSGWGWGQRCEGIGSVWHHYGVAPKFTIRWLPAKGGALASYTYGLLAALYCRLVARPDLVYARHLPGALMVTALKGRAVFELHDVPSAFGRAGSTLFELLLRQECLDRLVVISQSLKEFVLSAWPQLLVRDQVQVAADGVDLARHSRLPGPSVARARLGLNEGGAMMVGYVGNLYPGRGTELVIELARRFPEVCFVVIGGSANEIRSLETQVKRLRVENMSFLGFVAHGEVPLHLAACDILVMPYQRQVSVVGGSGNIVQWMSPLKMFEYMAAERPIVASDLPSLREVLNDGNAVLVDPEDVDAWSVALQELIADPEGRQRLAARARHDVESYTWAVRVDRCLGPEPPLRGSQESTEL